MAVIKYKSGETFVDIPTIRGAKGNDYALSYTNVNVVTDTYECDLEGSSAVNFALAIADTNPKVITFVNLPVGRAEVFLEIVTSAVASVTWTLNGGSTLAWSTGIAPTLASGKTYRVLFMTSDSGATWDAFASAGI
jgi:hypothetical protein